MRTHHCLQKDYLMRTHHCQLFKMGYVRLKIRELAEQRGWTLKDVANRSGVNYNTVRSYVQRGALNTVDLSAVFRIAQAFEVTLEELVEVVED
jgi:transcriptional regulator with XRE-family HTH domain